MDYILDCVKKFLKGLILVLAVVGSGALVVKTWPYVKPLIVEHFYEPHVINASCVIDPSVLRDKTVIM